MPEHAQLFFTSIEQRARKAGRSLADLDLLMTAGTVAFMDDLKPLLATLKVPLAFSLGAMGSRKHNFYNAVFQRAGYADLVLRIQGLWLQGQRREAIALIPDDLILKTNLIGTKEMVRECLRLYQQAGVTTLNIGVAGQTLDERLNTLGQLIDLLNEVKG